ncbi:hypothetical protein NHP190012_11210 [Helicobacter sp. NHP19-012]|uniref:Uncharacterized protein n=1 Tax=Helicobacter gastrofelis TaxID=2849642 RepID=A0ABM7SF90_9HELI|nr:MULTISPECIES: hypothetical protein [unclassified Helicobacter]BCZ19479.1 hypothetical protein NHP190012_11210 [Helicobacter sp. NHP19-012]GMB96466.1 hypothetical protein NHP22001_10550 [Helicobacter sp. NHP22-001]
MNTETQGQDQEQQPRPPKKRNRKPQSKGAAYYEGLSPRKLGVCVNSLMDRYNKAHNDYIQAQIKLEEAHAQVQFFANETQLAKNAFNKKMRNGGQAKLVVSPAQAPNVNLANTSWQSTQEPKQPIENAEVANADLKPTSQDEYDMPF